MFADAGRTSWAEQREGERPYLVAEVEGRVVGQGDRGVRELPSALILSPLGYSDGSQEDPRGWAYDSSSQISGMVIPGEAEPTEDRYTELTGLDTHLGRMLKRQLDRWAYS